mgnify:CR=1 FL=1
MKKSIFTTALLIGSLLFTGCNNAQTDNIEKINSIQTNTDNSEVVSASSDTTNNPELDSVNEDRKNKYIANKSKIFRQDANANVITNNNSIK